MSTVFRVVKNSNYTILSNYHFKDKRLSWKAKGLLSTMLSLPENWNYTIEGLSKLSDDGIKATNSGLIELEKCGYLVRKQSRDRNGHFGLAEYYVYEQPVSGETTEIQEPLQDIPKEENLPLCQNGQTVENTGFSPLCQKRQTEKRITEKGAQLNTNILNTNKLISSSSSVSSQRKTEEAIRLMEEEEEARLKKRLELQKAEKQYSRELVQAVYQEIVKRDAEFIQLMNARALLQICQAVIDKQSREPIRMLPNLISKYLDNIMIGIKASNGIHNARDSSRPVNDRSDPCSQFNQFMHREYDCNALENEILSN